MNTGGATVNRGEIVSIVTDADILCVVELLTCCCLGCELGWD